jgi:hypothetical protein
MNYIGGLRAEPEAHRFDIRLGKTKLPYYRLVSAKGESDLVPRKSSKIRAPAYLVYSLMG